MSVSVRRVSPSRSVILLEICEACGAALAVSMLGLNAGQEAQKSHFVRQLR
jgi:hypothetical protein